jgi:hypothetical protein
VPIAHQAPDQRRTEEARSTGDENASRHCGPSE